MEIPYRVPLRFLLTKFCLAEKEEAAARRAAKNAKKRAAAQEKAALAKKVAQEKLLLAQSDRSAAFDQLTACAKVHDDEEYYAACETVKKLISDKNVQVSGWEKLPDLAPEVQSSTRPMQQSTLLHLAVQASDPELVAWFCNRGEGPFHVGP